MCGSALDAADFAALMGEERAAVVFADPPYNVRIDGHASGLGAIHHHQFPMASGEMDRAQFTTFLTQACQKLLMAGETMAARQLTYFAAREKRQRPRCEAGMAKSLAAHVAWSNSDNALQICGGNGYALEYPISRVLCDARILNIFEGAAEIQAQIIARGLITGRN